MRIYAPPRAIRGRQADGASKMSARHTTQPKHVRVRGRVHGSPPALAAAEPNKIRLSIIITL